MSYVVAVDVGGTEIKSALVDFDFNVIAIITAPTPKADSTGAETVKAIAAIVAEFGATQKVEAVGLAVPGALDEPAGTSRWSGNLQWKNLPIRDLLHAEINIPVAFGHDVRTAAVAELRSGAAQGARNAIFIPVGTGIAAALIIDGEIRSAEGYAGEIGHIDVNGKYPCVCGKTGCLEAASSTLAISKAYEAQSGKTGTTTEEIYKLVVAGDAVATRVWNDATAAMARACETLITLLAPEVIVFGGGLSNAGDTFLNPIQDYLDASLTFQRKPRLEIAHYGSKAGTIGCAMLAFDLVKAGK
ncbi:NagC Transcriptional regulator/sugar kinase [Candidatus Nanopelagicaceae bacterium]